MFQKKTLRLAIKVCFLFIMMGATINLTYSPKSSAATSCPPEVYDSCLSPGTLYIVDSDSCQCYCPTHTGLCSTPSNPTGLTDQSTCTCAELFDACNDPVGVDNCIGGGGIWDSNHCICRFP